ncbi:MAG: hypothetical protein SF053_15490 [Bacteroidia bacterium]|nr:hypothetical protein [Bacteroidia bacterium]
MQGTVLREQGVISYEANIALFEKIQKARPDKRIVVYADNPT